MLRVRSCGQRKDSAQEFLFISLQPSCVAQAVFRSSVSPGSVSSLGILCMCSHAFREGSVVEMLLCWWDGEVGMGCWVTAPSLAGFRPGMLGTPSWALTILPSVWEGGGQSAVVSSLCLLVGSALWEGWWSSQSSHFQRDVVSCACLAALSQNITDQGSGRQGCLSRKGFCGGCSVARRRSWSLTGSRGWGVSPLPE